MQYDNHFQESSPGQPSSTDYPCEAEMERSPTKPSSSSLSMSPSSFPSLSSPSSPTLQNGANNRNQAEINNDGMETDGVEATQGRQFSTEINDAVVLTMAATITSPSSKEDNDGVYQRGIEKDDNQSIDLSDLRKKRLIKISWYIVIGAFLLAGPMFVAGIVLGVISYSDRTDVSWLRKPADIVLSIFFFLLAVGVVLLIFHYARTRCWMKKERDVEMTEVTNVVHDEPSMINGVVTARQPDNDEDVGIKKNERVGIRL